MSICCLFKGLIPTQYKVCGLLSYFHIVMEKGLYMPDSACLNNIQPAYYETYHKASTDRATIQILVNSILLRRGCRPNQSAKNTPENGLAAACLFALWRQGFNRQIDRRASRNTLDCKKNQIFLNNVKLIGKTLNRTSL